MNIRIFLVRIGTKDRSAQTVFHGIVPIASLDGENRISAPRIIIDFFGSGIIVILYIDSLFSNIARYLFGDVSDILLNYPECLETFVYLYEIAVNHKYR